MMQRGFWVRSLASELAADATSPWAIAALMGKYPGMMGRISVFHSALAPGHQPHPVETHDEEELIVCLSGELDFLSGEGAHRVGPGGFAHFPPGDPHAVRAVGPAAFLVFKWTLQNPPEAWPEAGTFFLDEFDRVTEQGALYRRKVCDQPLGNGGRMVVETLRLMPGTGYPAHRHDHDLILILLRGKMHGLGHATAAPAVIYYSANTIHGLEALNVDPIELLAFEFHRPVRTAARGPATFS